MTSPPMGSVEQSPTWDREVATPDWLSVDRINMIDRISAIPGILFILSKENGSLVHELNEFNEWKPDSQVPFVKFGQFVYRITSSAG